MEPSILLRPGRHYEAIATFYVDEKPWATPLGFRVADPKHVLLRVYAGTTTFNTLRRGVDIVLNIIRDPALYLYTAFKNLYPDWAQRLRFEQSRRVSAPRLADAELCIEARAVYVIEHSSFLESLYEIVHVELRSVQLEPPTRCTPHLIDLVIYLTKLRDVANPELRSKYELALLHSLEVAEKTCDEDVKFLLAEIRKVYRMLRGDDLRVRS